MAERTRFGCDGCHNDPPTQRFEGVCGDLLWICGPCHERMTDWGQGAVKVALEMLTACQESLRLLNYRLDMAEVDDEEKRHIDQLRTIIRKAKLPAS